MVFKNSSKVINEVHLANQNSETNLECSDLTGNIFDCAGQFKYLIDYIEMCKPIIQQLQEAEVINNYKFIVEIKDAMDHILKTSSSIIDKCNGLMTQMDIVSNSISEKSIMDSKVEHDPGLRTKIISDNQRQYLIMLGPHQPKLNFYPKRETYRFNPSWYAEYPHLEYSTVKDAAYCFVCCLFPDVAGRQKSKGYWNEIGVTGWKKMKCSSGINKTGKLQKHFTSEAHKSALTDYCNYMTKSNSIDVMLDKTVRQQKIQEESNRNFHKEVICILLDITKTLGRQGLAFRGKEDDESGNFKQITYLLSRHCPLLKKWLNDSSYRPYHTTYLRPQSQNEFINILASSVNKIVRDKVCKAGMFSVMADTTPDLSHTDRLSVVVRFVNNEGKSEERLLEVREALNKTGIGISNDILDTLQKNEFNPDNLVFQSYDFASSMSRVFNGAQQKITEILGRKIPYIPCQAHRINTFIEHSCEASLVISDMFSIMQELYVFFTSSTKRYAPLLNNLVGIESALKLRNLSKTRWTARAEAIKSVWLSFNIIIDVLDEILNSKDKFDIYTRNTAYSLSKRLLSVDFVVSILFMKNVMYKMKLLTECLESVELNIADAIIFISSTLESLNIINSDTDGMDNLIKSAVEFLKSFEVDAEKE